ESRQRTDSFIEITIEDTTGCPRYSARVIRNVKIGASPGWLVKRLESVGIRSINNVVDITNYVLMETGHPLHAFDLDLIAGSGIIVRAAREGETFVTLDNKERQLREGTVLICDAEKPVAIGGIMGGLNSEVHVDTRHILLESAYFNPESIQLSSRYLGLSTEASQRFERGADPNGTIYALNRASELIGELCSGEICQGVVDVYPKKISEKTVLLETDRINSLLGTSLNQEEMTEILESIDLTVQNQVVTIPTFRPDISVVADLAEEVARLYGLDNIPARQTFEVDYRVRMNEYDMFIDQLKEILSGMGLQEVITSSMINSRKWKEIIGTPVCKIMNPISKDLDGLRRSLITSLAEVVQYNINRKSGNLKLFETNRIFIPTENKNEQPLEDLRLIISLTGMREEDIWYSSRQKVDFYDIKGIVEAFCRKISLDNWQFISYSDSDFLQENGLLLQSGNTEIGTLGQLSQKICEALEIEQDIYIADLSVKKLFENRKIDKKYRPIPRFPSVERDLALIVDADLESEKLLSTIYQKGGKLLHQVDIFDIYQGKQIPEGKKSLAFRLIFQAMDRTLTEDEVNVLMDKIYLTVNKRFQAKLRA
ncbi:MAG: phenylalanine--tRNA ligase subunit beta, partial [Calditrichaeota bacterium]